MTTFIVAIRLAYHTVLSLQAMPHTVSVSCGMLDGMTQPDEKPARALTRPAIGVLVDPERMAAARKSAMLERIELAALSQALDLIKVAAAHGIETEQDPKELAEHPGLAVQALKMQLSHAGVTTAGIPGLRIGVSRDEIAKLESRRGKRPKITTLRKLIYAMNYARAVQDKPPLHIEDLQVPGEVLIPEPRDDEQSAFDDYQEASNEIYYETVRLSGITSPEVAPETDEDVG